MRVVVLVMGMCMLIIMIVGVLMTIVVLMSVIGVEMLGIIMGVIAFGVRRFDMLPGIFPSVLLALMRLNCLRRIGAGVLDDIALDALAIAAATRVAVARTAAVGTVFGFLFGLAMGAFVRLDQRLAVGDRNLIIIGVDFAEGQEAVAVAAILDKGRLQRRFYPCDLGEIDVAAQLLALGGLEIKFLDAIAADHDNPGLFRVGGVDQHFVGHFGTHGGGGRVWRSARVARPGDATVHLIRG
ncbi:MAG TPA: hypothetical protein VJ226_06290 [Bradyrhizobium sp.]|nr:hypothetical protein [Bradyrhizobium sp.]